MAAFGSFETDREVYSGPHYTVYSARKAGDAQTEYAIKVFCVQRLDLDAESAAELQPLLSDIERACVARVTLQQRAAAASKFVSPIIETGHDERGVWYATRFYPRSVNKIISGRVALNRYVLHHILHSVARGALDIQRTCGRSHGEILPSNIQISRSERLVEAEVVLSDPLPGDSSEAARYELSDLRAFGRILLQLVLQREITRDEDFLLLHPLAVSTEWKQLFGRDAEKWLALGNRLLDPNLSIDQFTLEQLVATLDQLQPKAILSPKLVAGAAAGVLVLGIIALIVWLMSGYHSVHVTSDPPGATILVNEKEQDRKAPLKLKLKRGDYRIQARHDALRLSPQTTNWVVPGAVAPGPHFRFVYGSVTLTSDPPGATITQDGVVIGKTPTHFACVPAGREVRYELSLNERVPRTVGGLLTNGQHLILTDTLPLDTEVGTVEMLSTPEGAKVLFKDKVLTPDGTPQKVRLEQGTYTLTAVFRDWPPKEVTVRVQKEVETNATFRFEHARVALDSYPQGATVRVGTNQLGTTPTSVLRPAGRNTFSFDLAGYEPTNVIETVLNNVPLTIKPTLLTSNGVFLISSDPGTVPALIFDSNGTNEPVPTSPGSPLRITRPPGVYSFVARISGLGDVTNLLKFEKRIEKTHTFKFDYGTVEFENVPANAEVFVDGRLMSKAAKAFVQRPGAAVSYRVEAAPDYLPWTNRVTVKKGESLKVPLSLRPAPVDVSLSSDPPGARFFTLAGVEIPRVGGGYLLPWGKVDLVVRHGRLGALTNYGLTIKARETNQVPQFKFDYGTLVMTNLPQDLEIFEVYPDGREDKVAVASAGEAFEKPGRHTYLLKTRFNSETIITNIIQGLNFLLSTLSARETFNSLEMPLVWVDGLPGATKGGWVGKFEVRQKDYLALMGENPSSYKDGGGDCPVENVSWDQATNFCVKLTARDRENKMGRGEYRLPTRQQWEFFAKNTDDKSPVIRTNSPAPVGSRPPNAKGLCDVLGNLREWVADAEEVDAYYIGTGFNSWPSSPLDLGRLEKRNKQSFRDKSVGFRVVLIPVP